MEDDDHAGWETVLPPAELTSFLKSIKLDRLDVMLADHGYDDVDDFATYNERTLAQLRATLEKEGVLEGHIDKLIRAIERRRQPAATHLTPPRPHAMMPPPVALPTAAGSAAAPPAASASSSNFLDGSSSSAVASTSLPLPVATPAAPSAGPVIPPLAELIGQPSAAPETASGVVQAALLASPSGTIQLAANAAGAIAANKRQEAHVAKVHDFIEQRTKLHPDAPRILYGRDHSNPIKPLEVRMNAEALTLLKADPNLVTFANGRMQTQPLIDAARAAAYGGGYHLAKGFSKSTGVAGQLAPRPVSKAAFTSPGVSALERSRTPWTQPALNAVKQRVTAAVRTSELELLPRQLADLEEKLKAERSLRGELQRRGEQADLREALALGDKIDEHQRELEQKKLSLKSLSAKEAKASVDKARPDGVSTIAGGSHTPVPAVTAESLPHLAKSLDELERTRSLAEQINHTAAFDRASTWVTFVGASTAMCRVSPLHGISLDDYVRAATTLRDHFKHDCSFLIAACQALSKEGGHMTLKELWRRSGGPPSSSSAQKMIDLLMRAPLVAVRVSREDSLDSSWIVTAKSGDVNYARLGGLLSAIEKPATLGTKSIAKSIAKSRRYHTYRHPLHTAPRGAAWR